MTPPKKRKRESSKSPPVNNDLLNDKDLHEVDKIFQSKDPKRRTIRMVTKLKDCIVGFRNGRVVLKRENSKLTEQVHHLISENTELKIEKRQFQSDIARWRLSIYTAEQNESFYRHQISGMTLVRSTMLTDQEILIFVRDDYLRVEMVNILFLHVVDYDSTTGAQFYTAYYLFKYLQKKNLENWIWMEVVRLSERSVEKILDLSQKEGKARGLVCHPSLRGKRLVIDTKLDAVTSILSPPSQLSFQNTKVELATKMNHGYKARKPAKRGYFC